MTSAKPRKAKPPSTKAKAVVAISDSKSGEAAVPAFTQDELMQVWGLEAFRNWRRIFHVKVAVLTSLLPRAGETRAVAVVRCQPPHLALAPEHQQPASRRWHRG